MRQTLLLVSAFSLTILLAGCAAYTERQFSPDSDCVNCPRTADGVDMPDAPAGGDGDAGGGGGGGGGVY